jgi:hypothetical protein
MRHPSARYTTASCSLRCASSSSARRWTRSRRPRGDDGRLAIEPSANPSALIIRWFGTRYTLRVPGRWPFTAHEVRLAQAIGAVLRRDIEPFRTRGSSPSARICSAA